MKRKRKRFSLIKRLSALLGVLTLLFAGGAILLTQVTTMMILALVTAVSLITIPAVSEGGSILEVITTMIEIVADAVMAIIEAIASIFNL
jgi:hypothetical protein